MRTSPSSPNLPKKLSKSVFLNLDHLTSNSLLNLFQSAYTKLYSAETTLLSLHDHLSNAISKQQVFCHCLLDLSAACDTLDHSILQHRLSTWKVSKYFKVVPYICALALTISDILTNILNSLSSKIRSRSRNTISQITPFDGKCQKLQISRAHFCASS